MNIFVRNIDTARSENVGPLRLTSSIKVLRQRVAEKEKWRVEQVRMLFGGKELRDGEFLSECGRTRGDKWTCADLGMGGQKIRL